LPVPPEPLELPEPPEPEFADPPPLEFTAVPLVQAIKKIVSRSKHAEQNSFQAECQSGDMVALFFRKRAR